MKTSIGIHEDTRDALARVKPPSLSWDGFLTILRNSIDEKAFRKNLETALDEMEKGSIDSAIARVHAMRTGEAAALSYREAKKRLKIRKLTARLARLTETLEAGEASEVDRIVRDIDDELHAIIET